MIDNKYRTQMLTDALEGRIREVTEYQVNADNFRLAIERIGDDKDLQEFKGQLQSLLESTLLEQRKAQVMLDVIQSQVE